jgi:hypothetical protein
MKRGDMLHSKFVILLLNLHAINLKFKIKFKSINE